MLVHLVKGIDLLSRGGRTAYSVEHTAQAQLRETEPFPGPSKPIPYTSKYLLRRYLDPPQKA